ncbi:MAG: hypothetical protein LBN38_01415 [Verrucomicrobiota bacterium]|jgi:type II secretory pathway pseudopilin PulG|nr:hypothetical protein [Verrucomicrobiota bacterium]
MDNSVLRHGVRQQLRQRAENLVCLLSLRRATVPGMTLELDIPTARPSPPAGFTLLEVLAALGLCVFLAVCVSSAVGFTTRAERLAEREGAASLFCQTLYTAQRLYPEELPPAPSGWRVARTEDIEKLSRDTLREWHTLQVVDANGILRPFPLRVLAEGP